MRNDDVTKSSAGDYKLSLQSLRIIAELIWKIAPILYFLFAFYRNQDELTRKTADVTERLKTLETNQNKQDRDMTELKAEVKALREKSEDDRQFYLQLQQRNR
jgi:hypothetical protein